MMGKEKESDAGMWEARLNYWCEVAAAEAEVSRMSAGECLETAAWWGSCENPMSAAPVSRAIALAWLVEATYR